MWRVGHSHGPGVPLGGQRGSPGSAHPERLHGQATSTGTHSTGTVSALTSLPRGHNPATTAPLAARAWCGAFGKHSTQEMPDHRWTTDRSPAPQGPTASAHTLPLPGGQGCPGPCRPPGSAFVPLWALHPCPVNRTPETNSEPRSGPVGFWGGRSRRWGLQSKTWPQAPPPVQLLRSPPTLPCSNSIRRNQELGEPVRQEASRKPFWP